MSTSAPRANVRYRNKSTGVEVQLFVPDPWKALAHLDVVFPPAPEIAAAYTLRWNAMRAGEAKSHR